MEERLLVEITHWLLVRIPSFLYVNMSKNKNKRETKF